MLTEHQHAALLMVIADLRIQLANALAEREMFKKLLAEQTEGAEHGDSSGAPQVG